MTTMSLSKRLLLSGQDLLCQFASHPIISAVQQPISATNNKIVLFRLYKLALDSFQGFLGMLPRAAQVLDVSELDSQFISGAGQQFDVVIHQLKQQFHRFFGELPNEVKADPICEARIKEMANWDLILSQKDGLQFLVSLLGPLHMFCIFLTNCHESICQAFGFLEMFKSLQMMDIICDRIDNNPKAQLIVEPYYRQLEMTYLEFIELEVRTYNYGYYGNEYIT